MQVAKYEEIPWSFSPGTRGGGKTTSDKMAKGQEGFKYRRLFTGSIGEPGNFEMVVLRTDATEDLKHYPRHKHAFDQVRLTLAGKPDWSPGSITPEGWVIYMGAGTYYGPYDRQGGHEQLHIQFEGAGCPPFLNYEELARARDELTKKGTFEKGVFTWYDEKGQRHNKDGHAATVEHATGVPLVIPPARFADPINMNPESYDWIEVAPDVQRKELGSFTEAETRVSFLKVESGASYTFPRVDQRTLMFVRYGTGTIDGKALSERDGVMLEAGESGSVLKATSTIEFFILGMPKLAQAKSAPKTKESAGKKASLVA
jgi:hypothetical protein